MGIQKCRRRARDVLYWPSMNHDIQQMVERCEQCLLNSNHQQAEPLHPHPVPVRAWQRVAADIGTLRGKDLLIIADYYSGYPEVVSLSTTSSRAVITAMKSVLARHGVPDVLVTDNAPQFSSSEFTEFAKDWQFRHVTSSPHYPRSNGLAEITVKTIKAMIKKSSQDFHKGLLAYRSTPLQSGLFPAQMLMSRRLKTTLPINPQQLQPTVSTGVVSQKLAEKKKKKEWHDRSAKPLDSLNPEDAVRVQDSNGLWSIRARVLRKCSTPRSYEVVTDSGRHL